jgi:ABC-2 type transport system ATP-binding protein
LDSDELDRALKSAVELAGLEGRESAKTSALSGGWRQRLALSAAILHQPQVLFLDEPTAGVDPVSRRDFWELLYRLVAEGITVFVTTHYMDEAEQCHRLALIQKGRLIALGSPDELKQSIMESAIYELFPSDPSQAIKALRRAKKGGRLAADGIELYGAAVHVVVNPGQQPQAEISQILKEENIEPGIIRPIEPSLEDVFIASMKAGELPAREAA